MVIHSDKSVTIVDTKPFKKIRHGTIKKFSYKYHFLRMLNYTVREYIVVNLNTNYTLEKSFNLKKAIHINCILDKLSPAPNVEKRIQRMKVYYNQTKYPHVPIHTYCIKPHPCPFKDYCWKDVPNDSILNIAQLPSKDKFDFYYSGMNNMRDFKQVRPNITYIQNSQLESLNKPPIFINKTKVTEFLNGIKYPLAYFDLEAAQPIIPEFKSFQCIDFVPFLFSCHYQESKDSPLVHNYFFLENFNELEQFALQLVANLSRCKSVMVYGQQMEKSVLLKFKTLFPKFKSNLRQIRANIIDLSDIFVRGHVYLPAMKGKFGLKDILLAIDPEHEFGQLSGVKNGLDASKEYMNYYYSDSESERSRLKTELSKYVNLDTKGIYDIYTYILNLTN